MEATIQNLVNIAIAIGLKVIGAIILWMVGRWLIKLALNILSSTLKRTDVDPTLLVYIKSSLSVLLNVVLIVALLGFFGIETTSFAALLAAAGVAIGAAWSGLLAHFAAGAFLIVFRPFKVGDFITAGGVTGTVKEIGLFVTKIDTLDNVENIIGNNAIFADTIQNFSTNPYRRVDLVAQLNHSTDHKAAINLLAEKVCQIPNVLSIPAPDVEILEFNLAGPLLAVRPYCNNEHYWQVYFDTNRIIRESFGNAGFRAPEQHYVINREAA
ncbi:MAG: mechanosensitive ion channel family protein [Cyanothece sp. SIO1E1]|nr:mechanosensitive ion channel family protein [Cyanothece sp. SIO1E1]